VSNQLSVNPMALDTDIASYQAAQTLTAATELLGVRVRKIVLVAASTTAAGTVTVIDPVSNTTLAAPIVVAASQAAGTVIFSDEIVSPPMWSDFKVTGLTATATRMYIWYSR
jgi:hypothetical protein